MSDGSRKVVNISEITGMEENVVSMQEIFSFQRKGLGPDGKVVGVFKPTQIRCGGSRSTMALAWDNGSPVQQVRCVATFAGLFAERTRTDEHKATRKCS